MCWFIFLLCVWDVYACISLSLSLSGGSALIEHASRPNSVLVDCRRASIENSMYYGYMERSYRNTMHDSKRVCLKEVIIILE